MPEYTRLTAKEAEKLLLRSGFVFDRQKGSLVGRAQLFVPDIFML